MRTILFAALAYGCASESTSPPEYDDLARVLAVTIATPDGGGDVGAASDTATLALGEIPAGFVGEGIVSGTHFGVDIVYMAVRTAAGTTVIGQWTGDLAMTRWTGTISRNGTWRLVDGSLTGTSELELDAMFPNVAYHISIIETVALAIDMTSRSITGGTIRSRVTESHDMVASHGTQSFSDVIDAQVTFDQGIVLTLDDTHGYMIDPATGETYLPR